MLTIIVEILQCYRMMKQNNAKMSSFLKNLNLNVCLGQTEDRQVISIYIIDIVLYKYFEFLFL